MTTSRSFKLTGWTLDGTEHELPTIQVDLGTDGWLRFNGHGGTWRQSIPLCGAVGRFFRELLEVPPMEEKQQ